MNSFYRHLFSVWSVQLPTWSPRHPPRYFSQSFVASQGSGEGYNSLNMTGRGTLTGAYCDYIL